MKSINNSHTRPIALTLGDPSGVGPEITAQAWAELRDKNLPFFLIGDPELARQHAILQRLPEPVCIDEPRDATRVMTDALPVLPLPLPAPVKAGKPDQRNAKAVITSIELAVKTVSSGQASALVTNPIAKAVLYKAGFKHPGHTEFLGALARQNSDWPEPHGPVMMLGASGLRVALVTVHIPLSQVASTISRENIMKVAQVLDHALQQDFGIAKPRIVLCGLNPHAGEEGAMGDEEVRIINPAAKNLRRLGVNITNAQASDALFREEARNDYDAVLALYHDQGLIPVKTLDFHGGINTTLGLPFIRVSPDHGTGFSIAGQGKARADSLLAAIKAAHSMSACRKSYGRS